MNMNLRDSALLEVELEHIVELLFAGACSSKDIDVLIVMQHSCVV